MDLWRIWSQLQRAAELSEMLWTEHAESRLAGIDMMAGKPDSWTILEAFSSATGGPVGHARLRWRPRAVRNHVR